MRILIVTDAWPPQVNGVVRTLQTVGAKLRLAGHDVHYITPEGRKSWGVPNYPEIQLALVSAKTIGREIDTLAPDAIHIATEGPLGWAARKACLKRGLPYTTSFHTRFAEYLDMRSPIPGTGKFIWSVLRRFHQHAQAVMVPTQTIATLLEDKGFRNVKTWTRGVNHQNFKPQKTRDYFDLPRPILLHAGRLTPEKNIEAFLKLDVPGSKVVVGEGPIRQDLANKYPKAYFTGYLAEQDLAAAMASADCFIFPSTTDTFGLVMIEAMACGTPVAAFPVPSPVDVIEDGVTGVMNADLAEAIKTALKLDRTKVQKAAQKFTWERVADMFAGWLVQIGAQKFGKAQSDDAVLKPVYEPN
ncbi:glycosyltransferase family 4 protein [Aestuariivirga litoralis]|uniref:glycosyltransferase family 4 protein n=1 Tax=Aestuariivirga litoralis TaxID=2650924 RepID=UPI0018C480B2|nr:glycosyltransferase family 1 protein [Aestuariivirga litoralis]MBG1233138.1 glycosyltransferase family 1 protein [Aestuariivirga litoralis]